MRLYCFLCSVVMATSILIANLAIASGGPAISITGGINLRTAFSQGEIFYEASFPVEYRSGSVMLSALSNGTGSTIVDDVLIITVIGPDSVARTYRRDYANGCGPLISAPPVNLANYFHIGLNYVRVIMKDSCGLGIRSSSFWLLP